uniref:O-acyltransferase WSD1 C-terminal domain-containing protein n=1 Tax=Anopheles merus TaxID=30066 RepID=A0A182UQI8_ANOME
MALEATTFFDWASNQGVSFWEVVSRNFTHPGPFGPVPISNGAQLVPDENRLDLLLSPAQFGLLTGVVLFLFLRHKIARWREEHSHLKMTSSADIRRAAYTFLTFLEFLALAPFLCTVLLVFQLYRTVIGAVLKHRHGKHFKGLLDGADVVWAIEDQNSRGMINIMANVEETVATWTTGEGSMSAEILLTLRKRISSRLMRNYRPHPKMFWKRNVELGYYFWSDQSELTVEDYIRYMDTMPLADGKRFIEEQQLRSLLSKINNRHLPADHTSSWEVLVGRQPLLDKERNILQYPILFRVHHSLGDGVALMRLLLEAIVDKEVPSRWKHLSKLKINYWIMSKMTCLFPETILRKILKSAHSTLAISNLPGPQQMPRIQGRELKNLCFFIPNLGTTAVGITLLTYGGKLQLGILADRAVIRTEDEAHSILRGTIEEIERMGQLLDEV